MQPAYADGEAGAASGSDTSHALQCEMLAIDRFRTIDLRKFSSRRAEKTPRASSRRSRSHEWLQGSRRPIVSRRRGRSSDACPVRLPGQRRGYLQLRRVVRKRQPSRSTRCSIPEMFCGEEGTAARVRKYAVACDPFEVECRFNESVSRQQRVDCSGRKMADVVVSREIE